MAYQFSGQRLAGIRDERGLSREQLAVLSSVPAGSLIRYERGRGVPGVNAAVALADALGVQVTALMDGASTALAEPPGTSDLPGWAQAYIRGLRAEIAAVRDSPARRELAGAAGPLR